MSSGHASHHPNISIEKKSGLHSTIASTHFVDLSDCLLLLPVLATGSTCAKKVAPGSFFQLFRHLQEAVGR
eukprot:654366-Amphidinium_carterae.1